LTLTTDLQISPASADAPLSPRQKRFNTLLRQIDKARQQIVLWKEQASHFAVAHAQRIQPLEDQWLDALRQSVLALDVLLDGEGWTAPEREILGAMLCEAASVLLEEGDDPRMKALFDKHSPMDFDTTRREAMLDMKDRAEAMMGLDLGDDEAFETEEDLLAHVRQVFEEREAAEEAARSTHAAGRRKTAAQQKREAEAQQATQSLREIYRKLASALHPDREPDARRREEKNALMQRVNQAYEASDLPALLELQLRIEQIDERQLANASAERLKQYNRLLNEQLAGLRAEITHIEIDFCLAFGLAAAPGLNPRHLGLRLKGMERDWAIRLHDQQIRLDMLRDPKAVRRWLKRRRQELRAMPFAFEPF